MGYTTTDDSEAAYLESQSDDGAEEDAIQESLDLWERKARLLYITARKAKVGDTIQCPSCKRSIVKTAYNKTFCSNQKTAKRGTLSCKDRYWNTLRDWRTLYSQEDTSDYEFQN